MTKEETYEKRIRELEAEIHRLAEEQAKLQSQLLQASRIQWNNTKIGYGTPDFVDPRYPEL
jgi:chaperonin cofactor prefoldin